MHCNLRAVTLILVLLTLAEEAKCVQKMSSPRPRVLVTYDMEGLAGQDDWRTASAWWPEQYAIGQKLLAEDVNAVVAGLFDAGTAIVDVLDQHGSGNPGTNLPAELLDRRVRHLLNRHDAPRPVPHLYDGLVIVAAHAKTGSGGFMAHTGTFGIERIINGRSVSEAEGQAYSWGEAGVPVIFVSGDDRLRDDLLPIMPWLEYIVTKRALSPKTVVLRPVEAVRRELREGAKRAVQNLSHAKPLRMGRPVRAALRAVPPADFAVMENVPGVNYLDGAVWFEAPDYETAMRGLRALQHIAELGGAPVVEELLKRSSLWPQIERLREAGYWERWIELESERVKPKSSGRAIWPTSRGNPCER